MNAAIAGGRSGLAVWTIVPEGERMTDKSAAKYSSAVIDDAAGVRYVVFDQTGMY
jgi:hypothetical protein